MALFKRYNSTTQQWEVIGGGGGSTHLADLTTIGGVQALKASTLVSNLCEDTGFRTWADSQTPPVDYTSSRTWDRDINTVLQVYTKYTQDTNGVVELWGSNLLDDVSNTNQLYSMSSITTPTTKNFGVVKATGIYEMSSLLCADPDFQVWAAAQTPPIDTTSARTWDRSITTALPILRNYHEHIGTFENHSLNLFDDISKTYQLFPLTGNNGVSPATKRTLGGIKAVNATEFVSDLCGDSDFQAWAAAQTPPIDTTSERTWDSDFPTIVDVYSRFMESGGKVAAVWGTNIFDNVDNTQQVFPISSIGVATDQTAGVVKGSAPYNSTFTAPVAVDQFGRGYCRNTELVPQYIRTNVGQRTFDFAEGVQTCFFVEFIQSATAMPILLNVNNSFVNYIEFYNPTTTDIVIALNGVTYKGIGLIEVHKPQEITVPKNRLVEVSVLANTFGIKNKAIITASEPLIFN